MPINFMTSAPKSVAYEIQKGEAISEVVMHFNVTIIELMQSDV